MNGIKVLLEKLNEKHNLSILEWKELISFSDDKSEVFSMARKLCDKVYSNKIYIRGLIEISNYCKNDCYYCGLRNSNKNMKRYRCSYNEIMNSVDVGYKIGFRTFVMQGGEDLFFDNGILEDIIKKIKEKYCDCAITLSIGEKSKEQYQKYFDAGADRFLLRHETFNKHHYEYLHPSEMLRDNRLNCLKILKDIGYQVGTGFMVGSPNQNIDNLCEDMKFIGDFKPHMVGIGPYITQKDTPFNDKKCGSVNLTIYLISLLRIMNPNLLIPATTALETMESGARIKAFKAGANVIMPNLTPIKYRDNYAIYDNKKNTGLEASENLREIKRELLDNGFEIVIDKGDYKHECL